MHSSLLGYSESQVSMWLCTIMSSPLLMCHLNPPTICYMIYILATSKNPCSACKGYLLVIYCDFFGGFWWRVGGDSIFAQPHLPLPFIVSLLLTLTLPYLPIPLPYPSHSSNTYPNLYPYSNPYPYPYPNITLILTPILTQILTPVLILIATLTHTITHTYPNNYPNN